MPIRTGWEGRFLEDLSVGDIYRHPLGRTISESDNTWFTLLTLNTNEAHFNAHAAADSVFGKPIVNSALTIAIVLGMSVTDTSYNAFANLGIDGLVLTTPVYIGDTIYAESLVLGSRESKSRPYGGIVEVKTRGLNQDGDIIMRFKRRFFVHKRDSEYRKSSFPEPSTPIDSDD
jgi:itaconyl-CoA hydratase